MRAELAALRRRGRTCWPGPRSTSATPPRPRTPRGAPSTRPAGRGRRPAAPARPADARAPRRGPPGLRAASPHARRRARHRSGARDPRAVRRGARRRAAAVRRTPSRPPRADRLDLAGRDAEVAVLRARGRTPAGTRAGLVVLAGGARHREEPAARGAGRRGAPDRRRVLSGRSFEGERSLFAQPVMDALAGGGRDLPPERLPGGDRGGRHPRPAGPATGAVRRRTRPRRRLLRRRAVAELRAVAQFLRGLAATARPARGRRPPASRPVDARAAALPGPAPGTGELLGGRRPQRRGRRGPRPPDDVGTSCHWDRCPDAVAHLAGPRRARGRAPEVMRRTGGHPLFVVEVLRALSRRDRPPRLLAGRGGRPGRRDGRGDRTGAARRRSPRCGVRSAGRR